MSIELVSQAKTQRPTSTYLYDPEIFETRQSPFESYKELRTKAPFYWHSKLKCWMVSRYEDIVEIIKDQRFSVDIIDEIVHKQEPALQPLLAYSCERSKNNFLFMDPPRHTRLRRLVASAFTPRSAKSLKGMIENLTRELLDQAFDRQRAEGRSSIDLMQDLATPLPFQVVANLLGIPREDQAKLKEWSDTLSLFLGKPLLTREDCESIDRDSRALDEYLAARFEERRENPNDDLMTYLLQARDEGDKLTELELYSTCSLLLIAGHETTTNLIGNGLWAFMRNPDQWKILREGDEALLSQAVNEILRFDAPVQYVQRVVKEDMTYKGHDFKKGQHLMILVGSAGRDDNFFKEADEFAIERSNAHKHLAFGSSIHFCIGAHLARLEGEVVFALLKNTFAELNLDPTHGPPLFRDNMALRGLTKLWVETP